LAPPFSEVEKGLRFGSTFLKGGKKGLRFGSTFLRGGKKA